MTTRVLTHKRGATFSVSGYASLPAGTWTAVCRVTQQSTNGTLTEVDTLELDLNAPVAPETRHTILLEREASLTEAWPLGALIADVAFTDSSPTPVIVTSPTFTINVLPSPSNGG